MKQFSNMNHNQTHRFYWRALLALCMGALLTVGWLASVWSASAALDVPQLITYQARLTDGDRITVDDASYNMRFAIYDAATAGTCLWSADDTDTNSATIDCPSNAPGGAISVTVTDGIFTVLLGDTTSNAQNALPDTLFDDNATLFLGVTIGSDSEMSPRKRIASSPYALQAGDADLLDSLNTDNDGCTSACVPVTNSNGNLVLTGDPQSALAAGGVLFINPASVAADETVFGISSGGGTGVFVVDGEGDIRAGSLLANIGSASAAIGPDASISSTVNLAVARNYTSATTSRLGNFTSSISGALNAGGIFTGVRSALTVASGAGNDVEKLYGSESILDFDGSGVSDYAAGYRSAVTISAGTLTNAYGLDALITTDGGTVSSAYGVRGEVTNSSGTVNTGYGGYFGANGTSTAYALYTSGGYVHIEGDGTATTPDDAGANGTLFVKGLIEADDRISIDKASTSTTAASEYGGTFDVSDTGIVSSGTDLTYGIDIATTRTGATGGTTRAFGMRSQVTGSTGGTSTTYGAYIHATGADTNYALYTEGGLVQIDGQGIGSAATPGDATGSGELFVRGDIETDSALYIDNTSTSTTAATTAAFDIDMTDTGIVTSGLDIQYGANILLERSGATGGTIVSEGIRSQVTADNAGSGTSSAIAGRFIAEGADNNYAVLTVGGYLHVDVDDAVDVPTLSGVGANGTGYFSADVEIFDGALCVGDGATDNCSDAGAVDGIIYSVASSVTQHDIAEAFPSTEFLLAGEIVSVSSNRNEHVGRATQDNTIIGAVSTSPGLILGWETQAQGYYPIALAGRTPIKVSGENGAITVGDRLAVSSVPGVGMKATQAGEVVGIAMEAFNGEGSGAVMTFIQPHYWDGVTQESVTQAMPSSTVQTDAVLAVRNGMVSNIQKLSSMNWSIDFEGTFATRGSFDVEIASYQNTLVTSHAVLGLEHYVTLAATSNMSGADTLIVEFEDIEPEFNDVASSEVPIVVTATMSNGSGTAYITDKTNNGFTLHRTGGSGTQVDWMVMGIRRGFEADEDLEIQKLEEVPAEELLEDLAEPEETTSLAEEEDTISSDEVSEESPIAEESEDVDAMEEDGSDDAAVEDVVPISVEVVEVTAHEDSVADDSLVTEEPEVLEEAEEAEASEASEVFDVAPEVVMPEEEATADAESSISEDEPSVESEDSSLPNEQDTPSPISD